MATAACSVSLAVSLSIALVRNDIKAGVAAGGTGLVLLSLALLLLSKAYSLRAKLRARLKELQVTVPATITPML